MAEEKPLTAKVKRDFVTGQVDLTATTAIYKILTLRGGQSAVIKALVGNSGNVYVGKNDVTSSTGFELSPGESIKFEYSPDKDSYEHIAIYAVCATAGDDVCYTLLP